MLLTFRLSHHYSEVLNSSINVTEPAAVKLEGDGGLGDHSRLLTDPGTGGGHRRTFKSQQEDSMLNTFRHAEDMLTSTRSYGQAW